MSPTPDDVLRDVFGYASFRERQREASLHVAGGGDAVVLLPTGAGKSLCFQVPALCRPGTALVVSPLVALMRDQVGALRRRGVSAAALHAEMPVEEERAVRAALRDASLRFLYVTPERMATEGFWPLLEGVRVSLLAVDEAHCVSTWGHDFRPDYVKLGRARERLPGVPMVAATATADPQTLRDLVGRLGLGGARTFATGFDRPNIAFEVVEKSDRPRDQLLAFLEGRRGESGIVYCLSRRKTEAVATFLRKSGFDALPYHAGLDRKVRDANQDRFLAGRDVVVAATIAFGMGIDKPDVRYVAHVDVPASVEGYYQEMGRAGRDGLPARAWMCHGPEDVAARRRMIDEGDASPSGKVTQRLKLDAMIGLCETPTCRRAAILNHFGEAHPGDCGGCDNCLRPAARLNGTSAATKVARAVRATGGSLGAQDLVSVIRGEAPPSLAASLGGDLAEVATGGQTDRATWASVLRQMSAAGLLATDYRAKGALSLTAAGEGIGTSALKVSFRRSAIERAKAAVAAAPVSPPVHEPPPPPPEAGLPDDGPTEPVRRTFRPGLLKALREERDAIARRGRVSAAMVLTDDELRAVSVARPRTRADMAAVPGMNRAKADRYGTLFLNVVERFAPPAPADKDVDVPVM